MIDDTELDLLVDGELGEVERRELLLRLEAEPGAWRRCALAFLEAQQWRQAVRDIASRPAGQPSAAFGLRTGRRRLPTIVAMAASFLLALALGMAVDNLAGRRAPAPGDPAGAARLARVSPPSESGDRQPKTVPAGLPSPAGPAGSVWPLAADGAPAVPAAAPEPAALDPAFRDATFRDAEVPYRYVSIPAEDPVSGKTGSIPMPVVPQEYLEDGWPYRLPSVLPEGVVRTLEQQGHEVVQQRRLVPLETADGSRVVFPVDEVELVPVARRGYQ